MLAISASFASKSVAYFPKALPENRSKTYSYYIIHGKIIVNSKKYLIFADEL